MASKKNNAKKLTLEDYKADRLPKSLQDLFNKFKERGGKSSGYELTNVIRLEKEQTFEGVYIGNFSVPNKENSEKPHIVYQLIDKNGEECQMWGCAHLNYLMRDIPFKSAVLIAYLGMTANEDTSKKDFHTYHVLFDPPKE